MLAISFHSFIAQRSPDLCRMLGNKLFALRRVSSENNSFVCGILLFIFVFIAQLLCHALLVQCVRICRLTPLINDKSSVVIPTSLQALMPGIGIMLSERLQEHNAPLCIYLPAFQLLYHQLSCNNSLAL